MQLQRNFFLIGMLGTLHRWRTLGIVVILSFEVCVPGLLYGGWAVHSVDRAESRGVAHVSAEFREGDTLCEVHAAIFDARRHDIRVVDDPIGERGGLKAVSRAEDWIAGVNGSYFHPDYRPLGLVVANGQFVHAQESAKLLSGILAANEKKIYLLRPAEFQLGLRTRAALQAGPFLVDDRRPVAGLDAARVARRTFVATDGGNLWAIGTISPLTLERAGSLLAAEAFEEAVLPVRRALNLDGGSSSAFVFDPGGLHAYHLRELTRVRNYLGVVARDSSELR